MHAINNRTLCLIGAIGLLLVSQAFARTVELTLTAKEVTLPVNGKIIGGADTMAAWTFDGTIPGPVLHVNEGDTVDFTLINAKTNTHPHSIDLHAAQVSVLDEFAMIMPGETKHFKFEAKVPGVFIYHCGAAPMVQHIARGMYGIIIVEPKDRTNYPKADREYVLIQQQYFPDVDNFDAMLENKGWKGSLVNGKAFHYDPVHDPEGGHDVLEAKPGERVRIYFVNANVNLPISLHPIAGIWDRVYLNGNPKNVQYGMQTVAIPVASASTFDIVMPKNGKKITAVAILDHSMDAALRGAITILESKDDASPKKGHGELILK
jgi:nitrite reductase (NO-forming)